MLRKTANDEMYTLTDNIEVDIEMGTWCCLTLNEPIKWSVSVVNTAPVSL